MIVITFKGVAKPFGTYGAAVNYVTNQDGSLLEGITWTAEDVSGDDAASLISYAETLEQANLYKQSVRKEIQTTAGDTQSLVGTNSDAVGLIAENLGRLAASHAQGDTAFAEVMADIAAVLEPLISAIDSGDCTLTHHVKSHQTVVTDICNRQTAAAAVIAVESSQEI